MKTSIRLALMAIAISCVTIAAAGPLPAHHQAQTRLAASAPTAVVSPVVFQLN